MNLLLTLVFLVFFLAVFIAAGYSPILLAAVCGSFFLLYFFSCKSEEERARKSKHTLFTPVPLFPLKGGTFSLFPFLWPFVAAAALSFLLSMFLPGSFSSWGKPAGAPSFMDPEYFVSADDYERHLAFQRSFSYQALGQAGSDNPAEYLRYYLGEDGLIKDSSGFPGAAAPRAEASWTGSPPFQLEKLMDFLVQYYKLETSRDDTKGEVLYVGG